MNEIDMNQLLSQLKTMALMSQDKVPMNDSASSPTDFSQLLKSSIDKVNDLQLKSGKMTTAFELGDKNLSLEEVMIALQKANIAFQAMTQVRNKLMSAYQDIMNMPV